MTISEVIQSPFAAATLTATVTFIVFVLHTRGKEKRVAAITMFKELMTSEPLLRARLVTQEYLVPGVDRSKFAMFFKKDFDQITEALENSASEKDKEARFYIRAIPSFFGSSRVLMDAWTPRNDSSVPAKQKCGINSLRSAFGILLDGKRGGAKWLYRKDQAFFEGIFGLLGHGY